MSKLVDAATERGRDFFLDEIVARAYQSGDLELIFSPYPWSVTRLSWDVLVFRGRLNYFSGSLFVGKERTSQSQKLTTTRTKKGTLNTISSKSRKERRRVWLNHGDGHSEMMSRVFLSLIHI